MQDCSINDQRCYTSGGSNLEGVTKQQSQALNQKGLSGTSGAHDDKAQRIRAINQSINLNWTWDIPSSGGRPLKLLYI